MLSHEQKEGTSNIPLREIELLYQQLESLIKTCDTQSFLTLVDITQLTLIFLEPIKSQIEAIKEDIPFFSSPGKIDHLTTFKEIVTKVEDLLIRNCTTLRRIKSNLEKIPKQEQEGSKEKPPSSGCFGFFRGGNQLENDQRAFVQKLNNEPHKYHYRRMLSILLNNIYIAHPNVVEGKWRSTMAAIVNQVNNEPSYNLTQSGC